MSIPLSRLVDEAVIQQQLAEGEPLLSVFKQHLNTAKEQLDIRFKANDSIHAIVAGRAQVVDTLLDIAWQQFNWPDQDQITLAAVGGYGRGELHPYSDIDVLILIDDAQSSESNQTKLEEEIGRFITFLWDTGLEIGHSVRTVSQCAEEAEKDITVITNLIESRALAGSETLLEQVHQAISSDKMWSSTDFFKAKWEEQKARHKKFNDTEYNLEPNVKSSPGGMRDIQMVSWVTNRHYGSGDLNELHTLGFLTEEDLEIINEGLSFLWRVRYALHMICGREEDRLSFDMQPKIAELFGFEDTPDSLAIEQLMKQYFCWAQSLTELNDMLLQHFDEAILRACESEIIFDLNPRFRLRNGYIEVTNERVFSQSPSALMEIFTLMSLHDNIVGVRAQTIRLIREHRHLINEEYRLDPKNQHFFLEILRSPRRVASSLKRMKRYGVLGKYIPAFGDIVGQSQHDLFHIYTVDAHTILVIANMRRFGYQVENDGLQVVNLVINRLPKIELLYLAGLFHDIGKGRGGDHSKLGAVDAYEFCQEHGYNQRDSNLVSWLVKNHLYMSAIAQRKDINDPDVIHDFALKMGDQVRLDYLYALTVSDINATNPTLWNSWRASLLRQLYAETKRALRRGLENHVDKQDWIDETQATALTRLEANGVSREQAIKIWDNPGDEYFLRETPADIAWHTQAIIDFQENTQSDTRRTLVVIKPGSDNLLDGATQVFIYTPNRIQLFALAANCFEQLELTIVDARIITSQSNYSMDTFFVLDANGEPIGDNTERLEQIRIALEQQLDDTDDFFEIVRRRTPLRLKHFATPTITRISTDINKGQSVLEVITPDRPGLLARLGQIFVEHKVHLQNAKIATLGERVEDVFFLTDENNQPITDPERCDAMQRDIENTLDKIANE